jgi:uncharacterized protein YlxW (UPF0749 family)
MTDQIERQFFCDKCKKTHKISLRKDLLTKQESFPFAYFYLHGPVKDILSTLYIDAHLNIRGVESVRLKVNDKIFSMEHTMSIVQSLVEELTKTQQDYNILQEKYEKLQEKYKTLKLKGSTRKIEPIMNK